MTKEINSKVATIMRKTGKFGVEVYDYIVELEKNNQELRTKNEQLEYRLRQLHDRNWAESMATIDTLIKLEHVCEVFYNTVKDLGVDIAGGKPFDEWLLDYKRELDEWLEGENDDTEIA